MFKKSPFLLLILSFLFYFSKSLCAQIVPGQSRQDVQLHSGNILWEEEGPVAPAEIHQVLYAGQGQTGQVPFLALYVNDRLLMPIFFVGEEGYMRVMARLQANPEMTQRVDDEQMISFISSDAQYAYRLSTALVNGKELGEGLIDRNTLQRYFPASSTYAIIHVDYNVAKALGYGPRQ